jgi:hypothetical protein
MPPRAESDQAHMMHEPKYFLRACPFLATDYAFRFGNVRDMRFWQYSIYGLIVGENRI